MGRFERIAYLEWAKERYGRVRFDLASNGRPASPLTALASSIDEIGRAESYQRDVETEAEAAVASAFAALPAEIALAPGTSGALFAVAAVLAGPGLRVAVERPTYEPLWRAFEAVGATIDFFDRRPEDAYVPDGASLLAALERGARVVVISNPHNPSGVQLGANALEKTAAAAQAHHATLVVDEVFLDVCEAPLRARTIFAGIVSVASLTKAFGLGALRFGWVAAPAPIAARVREVVSYTMGTLAYPLLRLGIMALDRVSALRAVAVADAARARALLYGIGQDTAWTLSPCVAHFGLLRVDGLGDDTALVDQLIREHELIVAPGRFFFAPGCLRVSAIAPNAAEGCERLKEAIRRLS